MQNNFFKNLIICLALAIVTFAVYFQVHNFKFVNFDDNLYVSENKHINTGLKWDNIAWVFTNEHAANWHPLTGLSHILDCQLFGKNPGIHHIINVLFHIANSLLLFTILRKMTGGFWQSAFAAALFALHPLHVESVAWISERKDVLSTFLGFLTILAYFQYVTKLKRRDYILSLLLFAAGLMAKPMLVTLPLILLLLDYWPLDRFKTKTNSELILEKTPFFILAAISGIITLAVQTSAGAVAPVERLPIDIRFANAIISYVTYIVKTFLPLNLAPFYPFRVKPFIVLEVFGYLVLITILTFLAIRKGKKYRYLVTGWLWYLITLLPVIGIVQVGDQALADRYTYIPLIGLFIIISWGANNLFEKFKYHNILLASLSIIAICILAVCTFKQISFWENSEKLFSHTVEVTENNYLAHNNVGLTFLEQENYGKAIEQFNSALKIKPNHFESMNNLGFALEKTGHFQEALNRYFKAIELNPRKAEVYYNLASVYTNMGENEKAIEAIKKAIEYKPDYHDAYNKLGAIYTAKGILEEAAESYKKAIQINPEFSEAHNNLAVFYIQTGQFEKAAESSEKAVKLKPDYSKAYSNLGVAYFQLGKMEQALNAYKKAVSLDPNYINGHYNLGLTYLEIKDTNSATAEYEILKNLDGQKAEQLLNSIKNSK